MKSHSIRSGSGTSITPTPPKPYVELARAHGVKIHGGANTVPGKGVKANGRAFLERIARNYDEGVDGIALFQTDTALLDPTLKGLLGPLFPSPRRSGVRGGRARGGQKESARDE